MGLLDEMLQTIMKPSAIAKEEAWLRQPTTQEHTHKTLSGTTRATPGPRVRGAAGNAKNLTVQLHQLCLPSK